MELNAYSLDCARLTDRAAAHAYLQSVLPLPDYYGRNLDALHDCLLELPPCTVTLQNVSSLENADWYSRALLTVFRDAAQERSDIQLIEA